MNQETNNSNVNTSVGQQNVNVNKVDPKTVQPVVLGQLRTEKIGNPSLLFAFVAIIAVVLILLPIGTKLLQQPNSFLYKLVYPNAPVVIEEKNNEVLDGKIINKLTQSTKIKAYDIVLSNFVLSQGQVKCNISSFSGVLNLDEKEIYLEIYSSKEGSLMGQVKLVGNDYDNQETSITLYNRNLNFNPTLPYYGKIVEMNESMYPSYDVSADETGFGTLTCKRDTRTIEYKFKNNYLIGMSDTVTYKKKNYKDADYLNLYTEYVNKAVLIGPEYANVNEEEEGFTFRSNLSLETYEYAPTFNDNNYYKADVLAKVIVYAQTGKGYDCK